jgi:beta-galactosidase
VGVNNSAGSGGLNPNVTVNTIGHASAAPWSRSLFNGLAQIIVQSARDAGEIKLTATAEGLTATTTVVKTQPCVPRPSMP